MMRQGSLTGRGETIKKNLREWAGHALKTGIVSQAETGR